MILFSTQPLGEIDLSQFTYTYLMSMNGYYLNPASTSYSVEEVSTVMPQGIFPANGLSVVCSVWTGTVPVTITLQNDQTGIGTIQLVVDGTGTFVSTGTDMSFADGEFAYLELGLPLGSGIATLSCVSSRFKEV